MRRGIIKGRGGGEREGVKGEGEGERGTGLEGKRDKESRGKGSEFVRASVCVCARVCRGGSGRGRPGLLLPSPLLSLPRQLRAQPRAGARLADSMLSLLIWILTLSDTFSQGKGSSPLRIRLPPGVEGLRPRWGSAGAPAARGGSPGSRRHEAGAGYPRGALGARARSNRGRRG